MVTSSYPDFGNRRPKSSTLLDNLNKKSADLSLVKQVASKAIIGLSQSELIDAFCNDLKELLSFDDIYPMITFLFEIESAINSLSDPAFDVLDPAIEEIPDLLEFYRHLSPILLRIVLEGENMGGGLKGDQQRVGHILNGWKEALRVAIEEELYVWKEKLSI